MAQSKKDRIRKRKEEARKYLIKLFRPALKRGSVWLYSADHPFISAKLGVGREFHFYFNSESRDGPGLEYIGHEIQALLGFRSIIFGGFYTRRYKDPQSIANKLSTALYNNPDKILVHNMTAGFDAYYAQLYEEDVKKEVADGWPKERQDGDRRDPS